MIPIPYEATSKQEERLATNRLLMAVHRGRVKVVDRISAVWDDRV